MNFDEYILVCFKDLDDCGKSESEKIEIINNMFEAFESDYEEEKQKFEKMKSEGNDMKTVASIFGGIMMKVISEMGIDDFDDLKDLPQVIKDIKSK